MITREMIIDELNKKADYSATEQTSIKNGIEKAGISVRIGDSKVGTVIYTDDFIDTAESNGWTVQETADEIEKILEENKPEFDISMFSDKDFIMEHLQIGLQREGTEDIVKRNSSLVGLEEYLYISASNEKMGNFSVKMKKEILDTIGLDHKTAWKLAEAHNHANVEILPMFSMIAQMMGVDESEMDYPMEDAPMYVVSNKSRFRGASAVLDKASIRELSEKTGISKFVMLPSSIHECILVKYEDGTNLEDFNDMVSQVNLSTVDPEEQLGDRAYLLIA